MRILTGTAMCSWQVGGSKCCLVICTSCSGPPIQKRWPKLKSQQSGIEGVQLRDLWWGETEGFNCLFKGEAAKPGGSTSNQPPNGEPTESWQTQVSTMDTWAGYKGKGKHQTTGFKVCVHYQFLDFFKTGPEKAMSNLNLLLKCY